MILKEDTSLIRLFYQRMMVMYMVLIIDVVGSCLCDLIRDGNVIVEKYSITFDNQEEEYTVLTIKEPCEKEIPPEVSSFNCIDNQTENGITFKNK